MDTLDVGQLAFYCSAILVGITWAGIIFLKPFFRWWVRRQPGSNDLVSYASAGFSLFYGLLLGLLSVVSFQNVSALEAAVQREASSIASLYRNVSSFPEPLRSDLQYQVRDYTLHIINKDWPAHRRGEVYNGGALRLDAITQVIVNFSPPDTTQQLVQAQSLKAVDELGTYRRERLTGVGAGIPNVMWYVVGVGAAITILLIWLLDVRLMLHLLLGGIISFFLGVMIFLIAAMDRPLQGSVSVGPEAYSDVYNLRMKWDEGRQ
jgi:hypothetical protein